ncbi:phospholipase D family protein [bacterium]|nr:phospholipase D family protein [bacterium]
MILLSLSVFGLTGCGGIPDIIDKPVAKARPVPSAGPLVATSRTLARGRAKQDSSLLLLANNKEALDWRLALVDSARSSVDIQLYLWHESSSGRLLFDRLLKAADRGVRVRILVDDFLFQAKEKDIAAICRYQPNLEIRIFNPTRLRGNPVGSAWEFLFNFSSLNRRMHNKTFIADRSMTIVGGRNVSDSYFGLNPDYNFFDLDVLASGPVVADVSDGFDQFWNSAKAYPGGRLTKRGRSEDLVRIRKELARLLEEEKDSRLKSFAIKPQSWSRKLGGLPSLIVEGRATFLQDAPNPDEDKRTVVTNLAQMTNSQKGELIFVSPYLIPSEEGIKRLGEARVKGIDIGVLAPSLAANNQAAVYGHYRKKRGPIIDQGVVLFELKSRPGAELRSLVDTYPVRAKAVNLHAKAVVGDRSKCFVGSLNLAPRAVRINTESGLLIDSPELSRELFELIKESAGAQNAWQVSRDERGRMTWSSDDEKLKKAPKAKMSKRILSFIVGLLPIEGQL